jgi:hypothetical protein
MYRLTHLTFAAVIGFGCCITARAATVTFFDPSQVATFVTQGTTSDTIHSNGYLFTYTRDKLFTGGGSVPIGRPVRVPWPDGVEAQYVTTGPDARKAEIIIERVDGDVFAFSAFTAKLLANTAGAGARFEVVPFLDGEEVWNDPLQFEASGYAGRIFSYDTNSEPSSTASLVGFDKYSIDLYVDFALIGLTFDGPPILAPYGDDNGDFVVDAADYTVWRNNLGQAIALPNEDRLTTPGEVTWEDVLFWKAHNGDLASGAPGRSGSIPEPLTLILILFALILALGWRQAPAARTAIQVPRPRRAG